MRLMLTLLLAITVLTIPFSSRAEDPWVDAVVSYHPGPDALYTDASKTIGEPLGGGPAIPNNSSVVSLGGQGGCLVLRFDTPVTDDPDNPMGLDCIVYSNAFWTGGNPQVKFQEPALIEISDDTNGNGLPDDEWYLIPGSREFDYVPFPSLAEPAGQGNSSSEPFLLAGNIRNPNLIIGGPIDEEYNWGYAEMMPTMLPYLDNYVRPDDPTKVGLTARSGGGDAFDIAWAINADGDPAGITQFKFIRLTSFINRIFGALGAASPEIDAVADVAPAIDEDGDGIFDEFEVRVAGTDPDRHESTILPLEIPAVEGGSPSGTLLGTAEDDRGTRVRLYSAAQRTDEDRAFSTAIDILAPVAPNVPLPESGLLRSGLCREIVSSESDFVNAGIQPAEITLRYESAEITGLDEESLEPFLYAGGAYTRSGITNVEVNRNANLVTFQTRQAGLFVLASVAGTGDTGSTEGPQGVIDLTTDPTGSILADPALILSVSSGEIRDHTDALVPDGTLVTVAATRGEIAVPDADAGLAGLQVPAVDGAISFSLHPSSHAGTARISATSVEGNAYGEVLVAFVAGEPVGPVFWTVGKPEDTEPISVPMTSSLVRDRFGNIVQDGTILTLNVTDADVTSGDADLEAPGWQVITSGGRASFVVEVTGEDDPFVVRTYRGAAQTDLLGESIYTASQYVPMPLDGAFLLIAFLLAVAGVQLGKRCRREGRK